MHDGIHARAVGSNLQKVQPPSPIGIHERTLGRWPAILAALRIDLPGRPGQHSECPSCRDGKDRFRFIDYEGRGTWYCSCCGGKDGLGGAGTGVDLVMRCRGVDFREACRLVDEVLPGSTVTIPKAADAEPRHSARAIWQRCLPIRQGDVSSLYLERRGIKLDSWPVMLRTMERALYVHEGKGREPKRREWLPAMVALFCSPDRATVTTFFTFLTHDGRKADVPRVKKFYPGKVPMGGAIRLAGSAETMGIAEGIETALSAMLKWDIPVWAATGTAELAKWQPPDHVRHVIVFGDADRKFGGQHAAYALGYRLATQRRLGLPPITVEVRIPDDLDTDWNDVLQSEAA